MTNKEEAPAAFPRPTKSPIQIIGPNTIAAAREAYRKSWGREWPFGDSYLAELIIEAKEFEGLGPSSKARPVAVRAHVLDLMRADDEF